MLTKIGSVDVNWFFADGQALAKVSSSSFFSRLVKDYDFDHVL